MRKEFQLTGLQKEALLDAMKPVPYMIVGGMAPTSRQENANNAWAKLGAELGFKHMTVRPIRGKDDSWFSAEVDEESPTPDVPVSRTMEDLL